MQTLPNKLLPFAWHFIKKQPIAFLIFSLAPLVMIFETNIIPYCLKMIIDVISTHEENRDNIFALLTPAFSLYAFSWIFMFTFVRLQNWWQGYVIPQFQADVRMSVTKQVLNHSHRFFSDNLSGAIANKINDLPRSLERIRMIVSWNFISSTGTIIVGILILFSINKICALILMSWAILHVGSIALYSIKVVKISATNAQDKSKLSGGIVDTLFNIVSVKLFASKNFETKFLAQIQETERVSNKNLIISLNKLKFIMDIWVTFTLAGLLYFIINSWQTGSVSTGDVAFTVFATASIMDQMWFLGFEIATFYQEVGVASQALDIISKPFEIVDSKAAKPLKVKKGKVEFQDVTFGYLLNRNVFKDKNIEIEAGSKVGLVGYSGSGKTTFVNLLLRFYDINAGKILIDGQDISKVTQESLHKAISMIPQDTSLFQRSVYENIAYGNPEASDPEVISASKKAHCHEFIKKLEHGYDSMVGERGVKLSGGQRQRIAIARAMLKDSPILILDEATSALDSVTEKYIQDSLESLMKNKTTIVIAHRLSTLNQMDRILVFDKGQIIEEGTHKQLLKKDGHYAKMWHMQAGGFLPEENGE